MSFVEKLEGLTVQVLEEKWLETILELERPRHEDPFVEWSASWREESLRHYLPLGWSYGVWDKDEKLIGYALAQPFVFLEGYTQTLWVEAVFSANQKASDILLEVLWKLCREKHFQRLVLNSSLGDERNRLEQISGKKINLKNPDFMLFTSKMNT